MSGLLGELIHGLQGEERHRPAIDEAALGKAERERALGLVLDPLQEGRVLDVHH